ILFRSVYGVDTVLTIVHRIQLKQNILLPHRLHFYQILANEQKIPHLVVSSMYGLFQAGVIVFVIFSSFNFITTALICTIPLVLGYIILKPYYMKLKIVELSKGNSKELKPKPIDSH